MIFSELALEIWLLKYWLASLSSILYNFIVIMINYSAVTLFVVISGCAIYPGFLTEMTESCQKAYMLPLCPRLIMWNLITWLKWLFFSIIKLLFLFVMYLLYVWDTLSQTFTQRILCSLTLGWIDHYLHRSLCKEPFQIFLCYKEISSHLFFLGLFQTHEFFFLIFKNKLLLSLLYLWLKLAQIWLQDNSCIFLTYLHQSLGSSQFFDTTKCSRLVLYSLCSWFGIINSLRRPNVEWNLETKT